MANEKVVVELVLEKRKFGTETKKVTETTRKFAKEITRGPNRGMTELTTKVKEAGGRFRVLSKEIMKTRQQFQWAYLNFLFAGMIFQRTGQRIARTSIDTFMKIEQGATKAGQALIGVSAEFEYLKFSVGRAIGESLKPLMGLIVPMIQWFANFTKQHPHTTFALIAGVITAGTFLFAIGQIGLFLQGLKGWSPSGDLRKFLGPGGGLSTIAGYAASGLVIAWGLQKTVNAFEDFTEGNILAGIKNAVSAGSAGVAAVSFAQGKFLQGGAALVIGFALVEAVNAYAAFSKDSISEGIRKSLASAALAGSGIAFATGNWVAGGALLVIGIALDIVNLNSVIEKVNGLANTLRGIGARIKAGFTSTEGFKEVTTTTPLGIIGKRAVGGNIPETGLYQLHRGEKVMNAGQTNTFGNGSITINVFSSGSANGNDIARALKMELARVT